MLFRSENRILFFRAQGLLALDWFADLDALNIQQTMETLTNEVYAIYKNTDGRTLRTDVATDVFSENRYGLTRIGAAADGGTDQTTAEATRDALAEAQSDSIPRGSFSFQRIFDSSGAEYPLWMVRSGDTISLRNLTANSGDTIDRVTRFRVINTEYDVDNNILNVQPNFDIPTYNRFWISPGGGRVFG